MRPVLVLGNHTAALHVIRSLGEKGIPVYLAHKEHLCIGRFSRYCREFFQCPDYLHDKEKFLEFLLTVGTKSSLKNAVLIPTNDDTNYVISRQKEKLKRYFTVPVADWDVMRTAYDKRRTISVAREAGIPVPRSYFPVNLEDLMEHLSDFSFPVVIKPAMGKKYYFATKQKMHYVHSREEAEEIFRRMGRVVGEENIILQEFIPGDNQTLVNYGACMKEGVAHGVFTGKKIRQYPREFGTGTAAATYSDPVLTELGTRLLRAFGYEGLAYIEFKQDSRSGEYQLIEINPRVWNFIDLAIATGSDLPYILYQYALGEDLTESQSTGEMFWSHFWLDLGGSIPRFIRGDEDPGAFFSTFNGKKKLAVISRKDPLPFLFETILLPYLYIHR